MPKIIIGVLRGGPSSEYEVSLKTGENVLKFLSPRYTAYDILITKDGKWHLNGLEKPPEKILRGIDVVFNALHGEYGEDGKVQLLLEDLKIPFTGSKSVSSAMAMNKFLARQIFEKAGIKIPQGFIINKNDDVTRTAFKIFKKFSPPWVLKPLNKGSSVGVEIIYKFSDLKKAIDWMFFSYGKILFEEYIKGREATCAVLENFRGEKIYAFPSVEIIPDAAKKFFDYEAKYGGKTREICPSNFPLSVKKEIENIAKKAHGALNCSGYSRCDFIVSPRGIFLLELNSLPGLTSESLLPKSAEAAGLDFSELLSHLINCALK